MKTEGAQWLEGKHSLSEMELLPLTHEAACLSCFPLTDQVRENEACLSNFDLNKQYFEYFLFTNFINLFFLLFQFGSERLVCLYCENSLIQTDFPWFFSKFPDFPGLENQILNSMIFQVFQGCYEPCILCTF